MGVAWIAFVDGSVSNGVFRKGPPAHVRQPLYHWYYGIPFSLILLCGLFLNLVDVRDFSQDGVRGTAKKAYAFVIITAGMLCVGGTAWIAFVDMGTPLPLTHGVHPTLAAGDTDFDPWPGVSVLVSACMAMASGLVFFSARRGC